MTLPLLKTPLGVRTVDLTSNTARVAAFVAAHPDATPFHRPEWTAATARACRQRPHYLVAERADGGVAGVLPLTEMRSAIFGSALVSAGFGTGGGILAADPDAVAALAASAWALAGELNIGSVELRGGPVPDADWSVQQGAHVGFVRALAADDAGELAALGKSRRSAVRRAVKRGFDIRVGTDAAAAADHYRVYAESVRNLGTPVFPRALFTEVLHGFAGAADILTLRLDGELMASAFSLYRHGTVFPYWTGTTEAGRKGLASDAMYFALMAHARARGCTRFDFGRSKVGTGSAAYKEMWGFAPSSLRYAVRTRPGEAPRAVNPLSSQYRLKIAAWQRLPLWAANLIGPQLSRGLG